MTKHPMFPNFVSSIYSLYVSTRTPIPKHMCTEIEGKNKQNCIVTTTHQQHLSYQNVAHTLDTFGYDSITTSPMTPPPIKKNTCDQ
mmetsp:Transcript_34072/g.50020  ORF Transcript_34072/g.50020 Transcript_34072/m.50020 type:complete len:86 (-) Transcript_34072:2-259(-)